MFTVKRLSAKYAPALLKHLARLDKQSLYDRFCVAANHEFIERYVNQINFDHSGIYGVFDQDLELIGVGECVVYSNKEEAEVAFSIELVHQSKGLGNRLMKKLIQFAKANNINKLNMYCLRTNSKSLHLAKKYGLNLTHEIDEVSTTIGLPVTPAIFFQGYELAEEIIANIEIAQKTTSKLWKIQNSYNNFMQASFTRKPQPGKETSP